MENNQPQNQNQVDQNVSTPVQIPVHTLAEDIMHTAEEGRPGTIKEIIDAEELKEMEKYNVSPKSNANQLYIVFGIILILLGGGIAYYFTAKIMNMPSILGVNLRQKDILHPDESKDVEIGESYKTEASLAIYSATQKVTASKGRLTALLIKQNGTPISLSKMLKVLDTDVLLSGKSGISESFSFGVVTEEEKQPFLMLKITDLNSAFPIIQNWEKKMFLDMYALFGLSVNEENRYLLNKDFEDTIVENKNTRVLTDNFGKPIFMYTFVNDNTVVFATSSAPVKEIIERIKSSDLQK